MKKILDIFKNDIVYKTFKKITLSISVFLKAWIFTQADTVSIYQLD
jgi:hypothetical protein